jgi:hypothetical protein
MGKDHDLLTEAISTFAEATAPKSRFELVPVDSLKYGEDDDDYLYHATSQPAAHKILKHGLQPSGSVPSMFTAGAYPAYSKGKSFLSSRSSAKSWADKVEDHLFHHHDDPPPVAVVRIHKSHVPDIEKDEQGTKDVGASFFVKRHIPARED